MLRKRSVIECIMDRLKYISQLEHAGKRTLREFINNLFAAIAAHH